MRHRRHSDHKKNQGRPSQGRHPQGPHRGGPAKPGPARTEKPSGGGMMEGRLQLKGRFGFVLSEDPSLGDVFVQGPTLRLAMGGDRVRARVKPSAPGAKREGEIVEVLDRARTTLVGVFRREQGAAVLVPEDGTEPLKILDLRGLSPRDGEWAVARITVWPTPSAGAAGELAEVIGERTDAKADLKILVRKYELPDDFPPEAESEARAAGDAVPESALQGRETFFHMPVFTIDGADAKDFDDALSLELLPEGGPARWRLGVHIADVAQYVRDGSGLDKEARRRGTSVYLAGSVVPMLPFPLSDGLCSLRPDEVRLTLSCVMDLDRDGHVVSHRLSESAIKSSKRFTYEEVEDILRGGVGPGVPAPVVRDVTRMGELAAMLRRKRYARGSLDFDFPEPYVVLDARGRPVDVRRRERLDSHRLVEEFMLLANETVAGAMKDGPFLYRVHERPDPAKLKRLEDTIKAVGVAVPPALHDGKPAAVQKVLESVKGKPVEPMVHMMVLRSLKQAVYSPRNAGHYGLASACYTHFTSPIRRYPDLLVHRMVKEQVRRERDEARRARWADLLPEVTLHCSRRERVAVDAEREYLDLKRVQVMEGRVGESFNGVISGVTNFGFFVQLRDVFVEGLVHMTSLKDDYYIFDEVRASLRGRRGGRVFRMGQAVRVRLAAANVVKRQLDFALEGDDTGPGRKKR